MTHDLELVQSLSGIKANNAVQRDVNLHASEKNLIELTRSIKDGEITTIKIQNGLPVFYIINLEQRRFD